MRKKISIIIPVYNVEKYIGQCLDSILNEKTVGLPIEVIVVNDGSPDNSMVIVEKYKSYQQLITIDQENKGLSLARNAGLSVARGEYVWFIDSDDWLEEGAINKVLDIISVENAPDTISTGLVWSYVNEKMNRCDMQIDNDYYISGRDYLKKKYLHGAIQRFIIRREMLMTNGISFYPNIKHEDGLFGKQIVYLSDKILVLSQPIYHYRQREEGSIMSSITIRNAYDIIIVHQQVVAFCNQYVKDEDKNWFRLLALQEFNSCLVFTWHLRHSRDFYQFLQDSKKYRQNECDYCMYKGGIKNAIKCILMKYMPVLYVGIIMEIFKKYNNMIKNESIGSSLSIIIPLYNKENTIINTINSVLRQTYRDFELIIVDDGSTDSSGSKVMSIYDSRIKYYKKQNGGVSSARNYGVRKSKSEWILFLDADDYIFPNCLELLMAHSQNIDIDVVTGGIALYDGNHIKANTLPCLSGKINNPFLGIYFHSLYPRTGNTIFRRKVLINIPFDERLSRYEDIKFIVEIVKQYKVLKINDYVFAYSQLNLGLSKTDERNFYNDFISRIRIKKTDSFWEKIIYAKLLNEGIRHYPSYKGFITNNSDNRRFYMFIERFVMFYLKSYFSKACKSYLYICHKFYLT